MAIRTITFSATANGVTPAQQYAGVAGEHNATNVVINLSDDLVAALGEEGTVYRFEIVDGLDRYDTSDNAVLAAGATSVNIDIPNGWTARGVAELRLVIAKLDAEGNNEMVLYSLPCRISFSERGTGTGATPETIIKGLSGVIAETHAAADAAHAAADAVSAAADAADAASAAAGKKTPEGGEIFNSYTGSAANRATAPFSHAEGSSTTASGDCSHAGGYGTIASAEAQTAIGKYNAEDTNALFIVGNGTSSSRSNAFTVKRDGSATVQTQGTSNNSVIIKSTLDTALAGKQSTSITDAGGYFTADTVEGALQEIGAQLSGLDEALEALL